MEPGGSTSHSQRLSNNFESTPYPHPKCSNFAYWHNVAEPDHKPTRRNKFWIKFQYRTLRRTRGYGHYARGNPGGGRRGASQKIYIFKELKMWKIGWRKYCFNIIKYFNRTSSQLISGRLEMFQSELVCSLNTSKHRFLSDLAELVKKVVRPLGSVVRLLPTNQEVPSFIDV